MKPVIIYTKPTCGFCQRAKTLLEQKGVAYQEFDARDDQIRTEMVTKANGRTTVPQIFIDGSHIGGCDDLYALNSNGKLDSLLN